MCVGGGGGGGGGGKHENGSVVPSFGRVPIHLNYGLTYCKYSAIMAII